MLGRRRQSISLAVLGAAVSIWSAAAVADPAPTADAYARAVDRICAHSLLFERTHQIGTRAGALAVAADIRSTARRRLARVAALPTPSSEARAVARWLALEQRLADAYASAYVRIFDLVAAPWTPEQSARAPRRLWLLVHAPDRLRRAASRLGQQLGLPDCVGAR